MFHCHVVCHPADLLDENIGAVLDCLQGRLGADGLTLQVACDQQPPRIRPHSNRTRRVRRPAAAGVYYVPSPDRQAVSRIKPNVVGKRDMLALASEHCAERGVNLRAAVQPFHNSRVAGRHPEFAVKNLFGVASQVALCPLNPDVRAHAVAMVTDLSVYDDLSSIVLQPGSAGLDAILPAAMRRVPPFRELSCACFCESCLQWAGADDVDADAAVRCAIAFVDRWSEFGTKESTASEALSPFVRYAAWAAGRRRQAFEDIVRASAKPLASLCTANLEDDHASGVFIDYAAHVIIDLDEQPAQPGERTCEMAVRFDIDGAADAPTLVQRVAAAVDRGFIGMTIVDYAAIPEWQFDWIRQATRHANRSTV